MTRQVVHCKVEDHWWHTARRGNTPWDLGSHGGIGRWNAGQWLSVGGTLVHEWEVCGTALGGTQTHLQLAHWTICSWYTGLSVVGTLGTRISFHEGNAYADRRDTGTLLRVWARKPSPRPPLLPPEYARRSSRLRARVTENLPWEHSLALWK